MCVDRLQLAGDPDGQALAGELIDDVEGPELAAVMRTILDEVNGTVRCLHGQGCSIKGIVRTTGVSRQTVRRILAGIQDDVFRSRETTLDRWAERLNADWNGGCRNGAEV